jgi:hypothetical protein
MYNYNFYVTNYDGRLLILLENIDKGISCTFYRSTGRATPNIKKSGEIFPILGILNVGALGTELSSYYPHMEDGWIVKSVTKEGRNDLKSYFKDERLKGMCLRLENLINNKVNDGFIYKVHKLSFKEWIAKVDEFHSADKHSLYASRLIELSKRTEAAV